MKKALTISFMYLCIVSACQNATHPTKDTEVENKAAVTFTNQQEGKEQSAHFENAVFPQV